MADTTIKVNSSVRDRLAVLAAQRGASIRDLVAELAAQAHLQPGRYVYAPALCLTAAIAQSS